MKKTLLFALINMLFTPIALADETYKKFENNMDKLRKERQDSKETWNQKDTQKNPFEVTKTPNEDRIKIYKETHTNDLHNNMSPKGKTSEKVLQDLLKSN